MCMEGARTKRIGTSLNAGELIGGYRLSSSAFSLMERPIGFDISDYVDGSVLIDATDIAKPHVIRLLNEYAPPLETHDDNA